MRSALSVTALAFSLAGCGDPLLFAEIEEARLCLTQTGSISASAGTSDVQLLYAGSYDLGSQTAGLTSNGVTSTLKALDFTITAVHGGVDFSSVTSAIVIVQKSDGANGGNATIATLDRQNSDRARLVMKSDGMDVLDYLSSGQLKFAVKAAGSIVSPHAWDANLEICLYAKVKLDALRAMQKK